MTKTTLLTAASVVAVLFAGAANAGTITGNFGGAGFTKAAPYLVASERVVSAAATAEGTISVTNTLTTPIDIPAGASRDHLVTFTFTGADVSSTGLTLTATKTGAGTVAPSLVSVSGNVVTYLVTVSNAANVTALTLSANLEQSAQANVTVASTTVAVIGATNIPVDTTTAVTAATYKPFLKTLSVENVFAPEAKLASYKLFAGNSPTAPLAAGFGAVNDGDFHGDLDGNVLDIEDVLDGGVATVTGPLISKNVTVGLIGTASATAPANTAVFTLDAGQASTFVNGGADLSISNSADPAKQEAFRAGGYSLAWAPKAAAGFTVPAASTIAAGSVKLEGTNFTAPWVSGTGLASSVIRVSNSNGAESGDVTVRLLSATAVTGGVAAPFVSTAAPLVVGKVPAGGDLQITSAQLVAHFGAFTRGDVQVTINSTEAGIVAKLRNTRDGVSFEQSLANPVN